MRNLTSYSSILNNKINAIHIWNTHYMQNSESYIFLANRLFFVRIFLI